MKKSIKIATLGVAALGFAAMPAAGVFAEKADNPVAITDTLTVNVDGICTFERTTGTGQYTQTMLAGALKNDFGSSTFTAKCNNASGYKISAAFGDLTGPGTTIAYSATAATEGSGTWNATLSGSSTPLADTGAFIAQTTDEDPAAGSTYTVSYAVSTHDNQAQGTYTGTAEYTLTQNN